MSDVPAISVLISADLAQLESNLRRAEVAVGRSTAAMEQTVRQSGIARALGANFDPVIVNRTARGIQAATQVMQTDFSQVGTTITGISGALALIPFPVTKIVGLVGILVGQFVTQREEAQRLKQIEEDRAAAVQRQANAIANATSQQVRELRDQLRIEQETDPIRKRELELELTKLKLRRERLDNLRELGAEQANELFLAKEALEVEKARKDIEDIRRRQAEEAARNQQATQSMLQPRGVGMGPANSIMTSIGGMFNFAQNAAMMALQRTATQQAGYQANLVLTAKEILQILRNQGTVIT